jgi:hypothetical protein
MRSTDLPQNNYWTGLAKERSAAEVRGISVLVPGGEDQKEFMTEPSMKNVLSSKVSL